MSARGLDSAAADRLCKLLGMLGSAHAGERAAAGLKANEFVRQLGLRWPDIITPALAAPDPALQQDDDDDELPDWWVMLDVLVDNIRHLNARDGDFIISLNRQRRAPSPKQMQWLADVYQKLARGRR